MRLGCVPPLFNAATIEELDSLIDRLDAHGLSAICAPGKIHTWPNDACSAYGEKARGLGLEIGEVGMWENLMHPDEEVRERNIQRMREVLGKADQMGVSNAVSLVGSRDPSGSPLAPAAENFTSAFREAFREVVLRVLDGLELRHTRYLLETWPNTGLCEPEALKALVEDVGHPAFGLHFDPCNFHLREWVFRSTERIEGLFREIGHLCHSVHFKDVHWDGSRVQWLVKLDEVRIGEGTMDYPTLLRKIEDHFPVDVCCYCEHLATEADYIYNFEQLHRLAAAQGLRFKRRGE
ncbi:MAG: sugar phosphate isomerase/epimerase family protein [Opitutales bacterium]